MSQFMNFTPNPGQPNSLRSETPPFTEKNYIISGVTKDETGAAVGGFTVYLLNMSGGIPVLSQSTISDAGGNYSFIVDKTVLFWAVDYKSGSPDRAGATLQTLAGV